MSSVAAATMEETPAASMRAGAARSHREALLARFHEVRNFTDALGRGLAPEDCVVQSMPDVSPTKWHLAHTTWFFETFVLKKWVAGLSPRQSAVRLSVQLLLQRRGRYAPARSARFDFEANGR